MICYIISSRFWVSIRLAAGGRSGTVHFAFDSFPIGTRFRLFENILSLGAAVAKRISSPTVDSEIPGSSPGHPPVEIYRDLYTCKCVSLAVGNNTVR